jgi:hypothetical protein
VIIMAGLVSSIPLTSEAQLVVEFVAEHGRSHKIYPWTLLL